MVKITNDGSVIATVEDFEDADTEAEVEMREGDDSGERSDPRISRVDKVAGQFGFTEILGLSDAEKGRLKTSANEVATKNRISTIHIENPFFSAVESLLKNGIAFDEAMAMVLQEKVSDIVQLTKRNKESADATGEARERFMREEKMRIKKGGEPGSNLN